MSDSQSQWLVELFERDLNRLIVELEQFKTEQELWKRPEGINNCAGNLFLHLCGNLQHFVGHVIGKTDYIRHREKEFSDKNVPYPEIKNQIKETTAVVIQVLNTLTQDDLDQIYPLEMWGKSFSTGFFLIHLHSHLNYHLGQINYYRRLL
ncbi:MAG: DinB family protein [Bacteroidota bacterium]